MAILKVIDVGVIPGLPRPAPRKIYTREGPVAEYSGGTLYIQDPQVSLEEDNQLVKNPDGLYCKPFSWKKKDW